MKVKKGIYRHYKGHKYRIIGIARHSETLEELVVYQGFYNDPKFGKNPICVRPVKLFIDDVKINGKQIPRFKFLADKK